jgi:hypothetical protein
MFVGMAREGFVISRAAGGPYVFDSEERFCIILINGQSMLYIDNCFVMYIEVAWLAKG